MQATTQALTYARNEYIKQGVSHIFDKCGDMIYAAALKPNLNITGVSPSRQMYWQFTATGALTGGMTGLEIRSTFNGSDNATGESITGAEIKARHTVGNAYTINQLRGLVGNADTKNGTTTTAYGVEASVDNNGGNITTAALFHGNLNNSGTIGTSYGMYLEGYTGYNLDYGIYVTLADIGMYINGGTTGIDFAGTYTSHALDFSNATQAAGDISLIRAGTYENGMDAAGEAQYGMLRFYLDTDDNGTSYNRGVFVCLKTSGTKGIFPVSGLGEVLAQTGAGPANVGGGQFIAHMNNATAKVATRGLAGTASFYGAWLKVASLVGSVASSGSVVAPVWLDNQMNGTVSGEEYAAYITSGTTVDAVFGFEGTGGGGCWTNLFYFDDTCYDLAPVGTIRTSPNQTATCDGSLKVLLNTTTLFIPLYNAVAVA